MSAIAAASPTIAAPSGVHDFDFLYGRWKVAHRRLNRRWVGETTGADFIGSSVARPLLGGLSARWGQAFSTDGGSTGEVNWVMQFERVA